MSSFIKSARKNKYRSGAGTEDGSIKGGRLSPAKEAFLVLFFVLFVVLFVFVFVFVLFFVLLAFPVFPVLKEFKFTIYVDRKNFTVKN
jgi:hypothetical protein